MKFFTQLKRAVLEIFNTGSPPPAGLETKNGLIIYDNTATELRPKVSDGVAFREVVMKERLSGADGLTAEPIEVGEGGTNLNPAQFALGGVGQVLAKKNATEYEFITLATGGTWDRVVGTGGDADLNTSNGLATPSDSIKHLTETLPAVSATQTVSKQLGIHGGGSGSVINGDLVFAAGSSGSILKNIKVAGSITINAGVNNVIIDSVWIPSGETITDNGTNTLVLGLEEE